MLPRGNAGADALDLRFEAIAGMIAPALRSACPKSPLSNVSYAHSFVRPFRLVIMWRHILPNSMTPVITFLPFRMSAAILSLTALDFLGLGVPGLPSLGDLLREGKENLDAWWISIPTFIVLSLTLLLLTFIGDALRDAFDTRKSWSP